MKNNIKFAYITKMYLNDKSVMMIVCRNYQEYIIYFAYDKCTDMTNMIWFNDSW